MFFKKLRSRSKSSSQSDRTKPSMTRMASMSSSTRNGTISSNGKIPEVFVSPPAVTPLSTVGEYTNTNRERTERPEEDDDGDEGKDYREFLEKARKEAEREEKQRLKQIEKARKTNMSPWASRM